MDPTENRIGLPGGEFRWRWDAENKILHGATVGVNDDRLMEAMKARALKTLAEIPSEVRLLIDLRPATKISSVGGRKIFFALSKHPKIRKQAYIVTSAVMKAVANFLFKASGAKNARIFSNEKEAEDWLKEK